MVTSPEIEELIALAKASNVPMTRALGRAGVATSTYVRWKHGSEPLTSTVRKVRAAIEQIAAERAA